jgi:hypothetical protein
MATVNGVRDVSQGDSLEEPCDLNMSAVVKLFDKGVELVVTDQIGCMNLL